MRILLSRSTEPRKLAPPHCRRLAFEALESRAAPGVLLPFGPAAISGDPTVSEAATPSAPTSSNETHRERTLDTKSLDSLRRHFDSLLDRLERDDSETQRPAKPTSPEASRPWHGAETSPTTPARNIAFDVWSQLDARRMSFQLHATSLHDYENVHNDRDLLHLRPEPNVAATHAAGSSSAGGAPRQTGGGGSGNYAPRVPDGGFAAGDTVPPAAAGIAASSSLTSSVGQITAGSAAGATSTLSLVDAQGRAVQLTLDENTIVVAAATWCEKCHKFKETLLTPEFASQIAGLRIVFAFGNEGGTGPGGVVDADYLAGLPGEVAFFAADNAARPTSFPTAYNPSTSEFDRLAMDQVQSWINANASPKDTSGGGSSFLLPGDYNGDGVVDAADYTVWRDTLGNSVPLAGTGADGNENGEVDPFDYDVWKEAFGNSLAPGEFAITGPDHVLTTDDFDISWDASPGALSYRLVLSSHDDLSNPFFVQELSETSRSFQNFGRDDFYVGVFAINAAGETAALGQPYSIFVNVVGNEQVVFVTSQQYGIDPNEIIPPLPQLFGSNAAADYHATRIANDIGLLIAPWNMQTLFFKAMITFTGIDLQQRGSIGNEGFRNILGQIVANNREELFHGPHLAPILDEFGNEVSGDNVPIWTGATSEGEPSLNCNDWSSPAASGARVGNLNGIGTNTFLDNGTRACHLGARLIVIGTPQVVFYPPED